ncbi:major facilitator superfamily domain-containing protein [Penicillium lagena]|uniref:major facilitator superfamily domain-containing protein n=1 Tax=Penicillium lagena TaxID=94218 RepID=UPI002541C740|nr:major facilitator superfamily domain-containing protein [Penicillium lagena]KAJ5620147.1 major facilitator superfamily domain-containing protein [Penicillium lagena]
MGDIAIKPITHHVEDQLAQPEHLSQEHQTYLLQRHGRVDLVPLPSNDPLDPLNWPAWKKNINLALVAFHGLVSTGGAVAVVPAFETWTIQFQVSMDIASYLGSAQASIPQMSSNRSAQSYGALMALRILQALFISPGIAMGQAVVAESFFAHERGQKMGIWALLITLGPPVGPFIMGFVIQHLDWRWMFWIMAIINFSQFLAYLVLSPETLYDRDPTVQTRPSRYFGFRRIIPGPLTKQEFLLPFRLLGDMRVLLPTIAYAIVFNFTLVLMTVEIPAFFTELFHLSPQQIGINFLGLLVGCSLGEVVGGPLSDFWQHKLSNCELNSHPPPERRLWLSYPGFILTTVGIAIFCVTLDEATPLHWTIKPIIGIAIGGFGVQIVTTICITYCSDCHPEIRSSALGVAINFVRCTWGFIGPFWFPYMFDSCGLRGSVGLMAGIIVVFSILPVAVVQFVGGRG